MDAIQIAWRTLASGYLTVFLCFTVASFYLFGHLFDPKRKKLPPGPTGVPLLGYIPFLPTNYERKFQDLVQKYGKIFSMRLGLSDVVVVSDFEIIKKITMQDVFNHRPPIFFFSDELPSALLTWNGDEWREQRKFSLRVLRHLGVGKQEVEDAILEEIDDLMTRFEADCDKAISVHRPLGSSVSNVVTLLVTGKRYDYNDPIRQLIDDSFLPRGNGARPSALGVVFFLPLISKIIRRLPFLPPADFQRRVNRVIRMFKDRIATVKKTFDVKSGDAKCFIEAYLKEMAENTNGKYYDDAHMIGCGFAFFAAGTNTTADFLTWFMLYMCVDPNVQKRMQKEIDEVIGKKSVSTKYRDAMPYTEAVIQELHRIVCLVPIGVFHATGDDCYLENYFIPKDTRIIFPACLIHMDPEHFERPDEFIPERFLTKEGKLIRDERVMPFGLGKRSCPGEPIAHTEIFLYIVSILQRFVIEMPKGKKYTTAGVCEFIGRIPAVNPVQVVLRKR